VSSAFQLPRRLPVGTKYVVEICGEFVRRFVELPNGARIPLRNRKARLSISSKRRLNGAGLQGPRWPRQPTRPNHRRKWRAGPPRADQRRARCVLCRLRSLLTAGTVMSSRAAQIAARHDFAIVW